VERRQVVFGGLWMAWRRTEAQSVSARSPITKPSDLLCLIATASCRI